MDWNAFSAISSALGAVGTLVAVIVALVIAHRDTTPVVSIKYGDYQDMRTGEKWIVMNVTNIGRSPVMMMNVVFSLGGGLRKQILMALKTPLEGQLSQSLPAKFEHGERLQYRCHDSRFEMEVQECVLANVKDKWFPRQLLKSLRVGVAVTVGSPKLARVSGDPMKRLLEALDKEKR